MEFRLLGPLEVSDQATTLPIGGPKQRAVLAHLALQANRVVSVDRLIDAIWGDEPPDTARNTLQTYVRHLRKGLGAERILHRSSGYVLTARPEEVDALRFEALVAEARSRAETDPAGAVESLREALGLWRGPAIDDLSDQASLRPEIARLEELRMAAVEERTGAELDLGRHAELVPELETLVGAHPLRERLWAHLMTALYRSGRQGDALAAFHRARELLAEELGIDPSPELQRLQARILRQDPALEGVGEPLRGYRLLEQVGAGSFGSVHRAFQPQVGREVAIKTIHPRFAKNPEFIRRFEAEAQLVARLEHPHVVPLYDFWREPDGAFLVMRYLRSGSLRERLAQGPLAPQGAARLLDQLALALGAAHRLGVVHRDVKPANILFDEEDNAYLSDFGIAKDLGVAEVAGPGGTPSPLAYYLSPEEIRGEPATPRTDIYSLGVVLHETLTGRHPFAEIPPELVLEKHLMEQLPPLKGSRPDLPAAVDEVIAHATAKDPAERYPGAGALASAFRTALVPSAVGTAAVPSEEVRNPYKGLRPFAEADAPDFFGREALVAELLTRLSDEGDGSRFLSVVGASGSGKSSLVLAGLLPALRDGALPGSGRWFLLGMRPGSHPFEELASTLMRVAVDPPGDLVERLRGDDRGLLSAADHIVPGGSDLLLVIDQFEEVFTLVEDEDTRARFLALLVAAATDPESRLRIVVTLRADFYDRPLSYRGLAELMKARSVTVTPLLPEELERTVSGPAQAVGVKVDPPLVADIVADVAAQPGALPLLQYALTELFERREDSALTVEAYRMIGGVSGALSRRAEDLYGRLNQAGQAATRQLFLRLVTLGREGIEDTRRRVLRSELTSLEVDPEAMEAVIDTFGARRLLSFDRDPATRGPTVEVAHEALLREWARLRGWIEGAREDVRAHRRLAAASREWTESDRDPSFLLRGTRLVRLEAWTASSGLALTGDERSFLEASLAQREAEQAEEKARMAREASLERRSMVRLRALVAVLTTLALVAGGLSALAFSQRGAARREARLATARELAAAAMANLDVDPERSILLALEAVDTTWEVEGTAVREAEEALHRALKQSRLILTVAQGRGLAVSPDGARFGTSGEDGTATVWETDTGRRLLTLRGHDEAVTGIAFSPEGSLLATTGSDGTVRLWDGANGRQTRVLEGHDGEVWRPAFSPDGKRLATSSEDETVRIWNVASGREEMVLTGPAAATFGPVFFQGVRPAFSPDGSLLAGASWELAGIGQGFAEDLDHSALIWDLETGEIAGVFGPHIWEVSGVAFSPDGSRVATASLEGAARTWDAKTGEHLGTFSGHRGDVTALDYSPDGSRIATGGEDGTARVWDASTGQQLVVLAGHTFDIEDVAFTQDGDRLLTSSIDGTTRLWDVRLEGGRDWLTVPGPSRRLGGVAFSPDGETFAVPGDRAGVTIHDVQTGEEVISLEGHDATIMRVAFSPDGTRLAGAAGSGKGDFDANREVPVWDVNTGEVAMTLTDHEDQVSAVAFSADGRRIATSTWDGIVRVWDAVTGQELRALEVGGGGFALAFSGDGRYLAESTGGEEVVVTVWDAETLERRSELHGHAETVQDVAFGPDGRAVTASWDGTAKIWDVDSGRELVTLRAGGLDAAFSPDGARLAIASGDAAKLWDPVTGNELLTLVGHDGPVHTVAFSPDGRLLATASTDGTVALHLLEIDELRQLGRERVTRGLTDEECRQYLRQHPCPTS
jgi:WD40 repeat protein/DNA-binding SARP family transcriptional activator